MNSPLIAKEWKVETIALDILRDIVRKFHYSGGSSNTATYRHGLFLQGGILPMGGVQWIPPTKSAAIATYPSNWQGVLSLSRLAIDPNVPANAATFLLSRSRKLIDRSRWPMLVTYADTWRGHTGAIYKADNWVYVGMTKPERTYLIDGRMVARKAGPKTRTHSEMLNLGAICIGSFAKHKFIHLVT